MHNYQSFLVAVLAACSLTACETTWKTPENRDLHGPEDVEHYIDMLESERRVESLQVGLAIRQLGLPRDAWVGDLGCGPGTFSLPLATACPDGLVFASDIEPAQLDRLRERLAQAELANVIPVLASYQDPHFPPARLDLVLIVDTFHHIDDREVYLRKLKHSLKPDGRLAVLEYKPGDLPIGPPADHKLAAGQLELEMSAAGWTELERFESHPYHDFVVYRPAVE
ncbi:MAG: class I SAM-dependent methyltransferase [Planctomycetes bacterium]|nr:class I SAM-dependent methyltransferase [Planctomycetota bacterium]MCB9905186.1 class I SAM-dependent methyltransferase [Planctomycetota bacterium]